MKRDVTSFADLATAEVVEYLGRRLYESSSKFRSPRWWGISSDAMLSFALGVGDRPRTPGTPTPGANIRIGDEVTTASAWVSDEAGDRYPHDWADLQACELTYARAPWVLQERMRPVLEEFRAWVLEGRNRHGDVINEVVLGSLP